MKITDLKEDRKIYLIHLSNKQTYKVNGLEKQNIVGSATNFVELSDGSVINKAFIVDITLDREMTKDKFNKLPEKI